MSDSRPDSLPWQKQWLYGLTNGGLFVAGMANLFAGTCFAYSKDATLAATCLTAGLVLLFAATIDRFESLKGLGIEAKTRQLDRKIEEADEALKGLRGLAEIAGASLIDLNSRIGRWDSAPGPREAYALAQKVKSMMEALGSDRETILAILKPWVRTMCADLGWAIVAPLNQILIKKHTDLNQRRSELLHRESDDPERARVTSEMVEVGSYRTKRLCKIRQFAVDDFPERFLELLEDVPSVTDDELAAFRSEARKFALDMTELCQDLRLTNPEPWFLAIEQHRIRESSGA